MSTNWTLEDLLSATKGKLMFQPSFALKNSFSFFGVGTDSRQNLKDKVFFALKGDSFDGHDFIKEAFQKGAKAFILERKPSQNLMYTIKSLASFKKKENKDSNSDFESLAWIQVESSLKALWDLASFYRKKKLKKTQIVSISGSSGKTTTKDFTFQLIQNHKRSFVSPRSFNNHIGVPLTLLSTPFETEVLVLEMGMNHKGELSQLCHLVQPDICLITNVGQAHIGLLGSQESIAKAKEELYQNAPKNSHFIFNFDNLFTRKMYEKWKEKKTSTQISVFSSSEKKASIFFQVKNMDWSSIEIKGHIQNVPGEVKVPIFGRHNMVNLMAASSLAYNLGLSPAQIWQNLSLCKPPWGRHQKIELKSGASLLFDAYNASPESVISLLENIKEVESKKSSPPMKKCAIFGEMKELGSKSELLHYRWGKQARLLGFDALWFIGSYFKSFKEGFNKSPPSFEAYSKGLFFFSNSLEAPQIKKEFFSFLKKLKSGDLVVIKGSRAMKLESLLEDFKYLLRNLC